MWTYSQTSGEIWHDGICEGGGYSGYGDGQDNPEKEAVKDVGPIPRGVYEIGAPYNDTRHGAIVMVLTPMLGTNTFGRDGFLIHGDRIGMPGVASHGCIVTDRATRLKLATSDDRLLEVTS